MSMMGKSFPLGEIVALDTEDDRFTDGCRRTRLIQLCPVSATSLDDVRLIEGFGCWSELFRILDDQCMRTDTKKHLDIRCYNLGGYEFSHMLAEVLRREFEYVDHFPTYGQWTALADDKAVYKVEVCCKSGVFVKFTDDMRRMQNSSMESSAESVRKEHPEWWQEIEDVKAHDVDYHDGWLDPSDPDYQKALRYAKIDAFSQAMIAKWLSLHGFDRALTSPGMGLRAALNQRYGKTSLREATFQNFKWNAAAFRRFYPPLDREMQDIAEEKLLGGFVWGLVGEWQGPFVHLDYSSSYPFEYAFGHLFQGHVWRLLPGDEIWDEMRKATTMFRWFRVSFDFALKEGMMPAIAGRECSSKQANRFFNPMIGQQNKKMREGHVDHALYTESYLSEVSKHYRISKMEIHEMWVAQRSEGDFRDFIAKCYNSKNVLKGQGLGGSAAYNIEKGFMNAGIHGKTITKTRRRRRTFFDGKTQLVDEVSEPTMNFLIGFTAMQNARERLLRHCRKVIEAGHKVFMCDTDSMVVDGTVEEIRRILGDWFVKGKEMDQSLGRFEIEDDSELALQHGWEVRQEFDIFKCWGLKRYLEIRIEDGKEWPRKTAFAGMDDDIQTRMLMDMDVDYQVFQWTQKGKQAGPWGAQIVLTVKHAMAENVWFNGDDGGQMTLDDQLQWLRSSREICDMLYASKLKGEWEEWD